MQKVVILLVSIAIAGCIARPAVEQDGTTSTTVGSPYNEEIVVVSSLNIRDKPRQKRQFGGFGGGQNYGQSQALANANAYNQYQGPGGFGGGAAHGGAQSFNAQGPLGGFGASAANTGSQNFHAGPGGIQGSAGMSGSQAYQLPGGHHIDVAYGQGFSTNNGQGSGSGSNSVTYTK